MRVLSVGLSVLVAAAAGMLRDSRLMAQSPVPSAAPVTGASVRCVDGKITAFACQNIELLSFLPSAAVGAGGDGVILSAIWGWVDSASRREFAIVGHTDGTSFVEVTDPMNPKYLGILPYTAGARPSKWRDMKVYQSHVFVISDNAGAHGMQVFDLRQLTKTPTATSPAPATFTATAMYDRIESAHTVAADEMTGFLYVAGANGGGETCGGGLHMIDVRAPTKPAFAGCYTELAIEGRNGPGYVHESQCVTYHGPDADYKGRELCLNASASAVGISDVTDKAKPKTISIATYPNAVYAHQGWFTPDQRYFFVNDELDELARAQQGETDIRSRTIIFDLQDLDDPVMLKEVAGPTAATDHNFYIVGRYLYQSNNAAGFRVYDLQDPTQPKEVAYLDTYPVDDAPGFTGSWGNFPYFSNGVIAVSSRELGLFMVRMVAP